MRRQREVPRWRRNRYQPVPPVLQLTRRQHRRAARDMLAMANQQAPLTGRVVPPGSVNDALRVTRTFRFRRHLVPFAWLAFLLAAGLGPRAVHEAGAGIGAGVIAAVLIAALSRRFLPAVLTIAVVTMLALAGWHAPVPALAIGLWLMPAIPWLHRHSWRPEAEAVPLVQGDQQKWDAYIAPKTLPGTWLADPEVIPDGRRWTVMCPPGEITPGDVIAKEAKIAGAWDKPRTEVFTEPYPDGRESRALLTILKRDTLAEPRDWDGAGIDPATGIASVGRFADGTPSRLRFFAPRDGIRHGLIAGASGSGKTALLDLIMQIVLTCGFIVPVVLDPQEGQSLPRWRDRVLYAAGPGECMRMLRGLHAGMLARSRYLAGLEWEDEGERVTGMEFFDHQLTGLPVVLAIGDEFPVLLTHPQYGAEAIRLTADIGKRGRKTGTALWPVAQVPSLAELGDQVVRSMLRGGNVVCLRTGDKVSAGYLGLDADPSRLPAYFADGSPTYGVGYVVGPDQRQAPMRVDRAGRGTPDVPALDPRFAAAMQRAMSAAGAAPDAPRAPAAVAAAPEPDDAPGRTALDAVLAVVKARTDRGQIIKDTGALARAWGRPKPFSVRAITDAISGATAAGQLSKVKHGVYEPVRPSLSLVGSTDTESAG